MAAEFQGRTAVITGGASGVGRCLCEGALGWGGRVGWRAGGG